jgi:8-oxo-(d)GTP phosphatase
MASNPPDSKLIRAAGAVAWRPAPDGGETQVLLVHRTKYDDWSLPKGKQEPGEPLPMTAAREVLEESGARLTLGRRLISVRYKVSGRPKRVHYWSARVAGTDAAAVPNTEVDQVAWLSLAQAWERATYGHDVSVLEDFAAAPADTVPLILIRHARAVSKSDWGLDDVTRPLDDRGRADAEALAVLLARFAPAARVISSPAARCMETVRPYAELTGGQVRAESSLEISRTGGGVCTAVMADVVVGGEPTVICAHRENLPSLLAAAGDMLGAALPPDGRDEPLPTAGFWVLHMADGALAGADRYDMSEALDSSTGWLAATRPRRRRRSRTAIHAASSTTAPVIAYSAYLVTPL